MSLKPEYVLRDIKCQLQANGSLRKAEREYLISAVTLFEAGEPLEVAFNKAELPSRPRGKASVDYQAAKSKRNAWLSAAADCFDGSEWKKSSEVAAVCAAAWRKHGAGRFTPTTDAERLIKRIIDAGFKLPMTGQGVQSAINNQKLNLSNP